MTHLGETCYGRLLGKTAIFGVVCLNLTLNGASLSPVMRKPFDMLAEGLSQTDGSGGIQSHYRVAA